MPTGMLNIPMKRKPRQKIGFGWKISDRLPAISMKDANVSVYAERVHWRALGVKCRSSPS